MSQNFIVHEFLREKIRCILMADFMYSLAALSGRGRVDGVNLATTWYTSLGYFLMVVRVLGTEFERK